MAIRPATTLILAADVFYEQTPAKLFRAMLERCHANGIARFSPAILAAPLLPARCVRGRLPRYAVETATEIENNPVKSGASVATLRIEPRSSFDGRARRSHQHEPNADEIDEIIAAMNARLVGIWQEQPPCPSSSGRPPLDPSPRSSRSAPKCADALIEDGCPCRPSPPSGRGRCSRWLHFAARSAGSADWMAAANDLGDHLRAIMLLPLGTRPFVEPHHVRPGECRSTDSRHPPVSRGCKCSASPVMPHSVVRRSSTRRTPSALEVVAPGFEIVAVDDVHVAAIAPCRRSI